MNQPLFLDRRDGGRQLSRLLLNYAHTHDPLVLGLPRGGVPVAYEVARALDAALDIFMVRKLGVPGHEELAMGAIATGDVIVWNRDVLDQLPVPQSQIDAVVEAEHAELARRERAYRGDRPHPRVQDRTVILVDDGLATGASMRAAARAVRAQHPYELIIAVPVAAPETRDALSGEADAIICAATPTLFYAVGLWYHDFSPTTDAEVTELLAQAHVDHHEAAKR
jgi:predicted phosphoribosyltransferase